MAPERDASERRTAARSSGLRRRDMLLAVSTAGSAALGGCEIPLDDGEGDGPRTPDRSPTASATEASPAVDTVTFDGGGGEAFATALETLEANPGSTLEIEPGTYHLDGGKTDSGYQAAHFAAYGLEDVTVEGDGALFVLEDARLGGLHLFQCEDTTVRGLGIEYADPPYTSAEIRGVDESAGTVEVAVDEGYPAFDEGVFVDRDPDWATVHEPGTGDFQDSRCCEGSVLRFDEPEPLGGDRYRLRNVSPWRGLATGRRLVAVARVPQGSALSLVGCRDTLLEGLTVHTSPLFVGHIALCAGPTIRDLTARPRPGSGRPVTTTADGFHVVNCDPGPTFEGCHLERLQDDAFAIDGKMQRVAAVLDDRTVRLEPVAATLIRPGDDLAAISPRYERLGSLPAVASVESGDRRGWPSALGSPRRVTFAADVAGTLEAGSFLLNRSRWNAGFAIRDCVSREIRARHVRITSRDGVVERNELDGCTSPAVLLQPTNGAFFNPKAPAENVAIRDNTVTRAGLNGFTTPWPGAVVAWTHLGERAHERRPPGQPIRDVVVAGNTIRDAAHKGIHVADTAGATVRDNLVERPNQRGFPRNRYGVGVENATDVAVTGNRVVGGGEALEEFGVRSDTRGLDATENELVVDGRTVSARFRETE